MVGALHTDNAAELVSREFTELMDSSSIDHTTSPPHVHQFNGIAERAIRSVSELARSYLVSSHLPAAFWPYAFDMAVDVLNRTSGPEADVPSYEMLTGMKPRVMNIMPFGCRAFAVKPREQYSKTDIDPLRASSPVSRDRVPRRIGWPRGALVFQELSATRCGVRRPLSGASLPFYTEITHCLYHVLVRR